VSSETSGIYSHRRYCLLKRFAAKDNGDEALVCVWRGKQEAVSATALASDFPYRAKLIAAGYSSVEDLTGADAIELRKRASLGRREADTVIAAIAALEI